MIGMLMFAAAALAAVPPAGTYHYVSTMNGAEIGRSAITVASSPAGLVLTEHGAGAMNGQSGSVEDTLTLDDALQPVTYTALASIADSRDMRSSISFTPSAATQTGDVSKVYRLPGNAAHFVLMDVGPFTGFFMLAAQIRAWGAKPVLAIVPNFAYSQVFTPRALADAAPPAGARAGDAAYAFSGAVSLTVWYDPKTLLVDDVDVPAQGLNVKRV